MISIFLFSPTSSYSLTTTVRGEIATNSTTDLFFNITLITSDTNTKRIEWAKLIQDELPTIGIGVNDLDIADWTTLMSRCFHNNKTYDDGGYDIYFVGETRMPLLWWPYTVPEYSLYSYIKDDWLFNFQDPTYAGEMEELWDNYHSELDEAKRSSIIKQVQERLYEYARDLPILYEGGICAFNENWNLSKEDCMAAMQLTTMRSGWANFGFNNIDPIIIGYPNTYFDWPPSDNIAPNSDVMFFGDPEVELWNNYQSFIWQGLYERNHTNNFQWTPLLANSTPIWSNNNMTATIKLRDDILFADGQPFTSEDVVESYRMRMTPKFINSHWLAEVNYGFLTSFFASNESISAIDDLTVQFNLTSTYPFTFDIFSIGIFPTHIYGNHTHPTIHDYKFDIKILEDLTKNGTSNFSIGTGPYMYTNVSTDILKLKAVNYYWNGDVTTQEIHFKNYDADYFNPVKDETQAIADLQTGKTHLLQMNILQNLTKVQEADGIKYHHLVKPFSQYTKINTFHPKLGTGKDTPLKTAEAAKFIRQAINHVIPRQKIINEINLGVGFPGASWFDPLLIGFDESLESYEHNTTKAKELMEKAGYNYSHWDTSSTTTITTETTTAGNAPSFDFVIALASISSLSSLVTIKRHRRRYQK